MSAPDAAPDLPRRSSGAVLTGVVAALPGSGEAVVWPGSLPNDKALTRLLIGHTPKVVTLDTSAWVELKPRKRKRAKKKSR